MASQLQRFIVSLSAVKHDPNLYVGVSPILCWCPVNKQNVLAGHFASHMLLLTEIIHKGYTGFLSKPQTNEFKSHNIWVWPELGTFPLRFCNLKILNLNTGQSEKKITLWTIFSVLMLRGHNKMLMHAAIQYCHMKFRTMLMGHNITWHFSRPCFVFSLFVNKRKQSWLY